VLLGIVLAATLATLFFVTLNDLAPPDAGLSLGLLFWKWFLTLYAVVGLPIAIGAWGLGKALRRGGIARSLWSAAAIAFVAVSFLGNAPTLRALFALEGATRFRVLCPVAVALATLGLLAIALLPEAERRAPRWLTGLGLVATCGALWPLPTSSARLQLSPTGATPPLLLVGVDGADWDYLEPLIAGGQLPHFAALRAQGAWGPLATIKPTLSPLVWTTLVTGKLPAEHGVEDFLMHTVDGVSAALPALRPPVGIGAAALEKQLRQRRLIRESPVGSEARRVPTLWNIATAHGSRMAVVNWWATTNPEPVLGALISSRVYYANVQGDSRGGARAALYPERLWDEASKRVMKPAEVSYATARAYARIDAAFWEKIQLAGHRGEGHLLQMLPYFLSLHETTRRLGVFAAEEGRRETGAPLDLLILFRLVDMVCHKALADSELIPRLPGEEETSFAPAVSEAYREMDRDLGELVALYPGANVVVVSDHGFDVIEGRRGRRPDHGRAPDGVFLAAGPAFRAARVDGMGVLDIMPLLLDLKGFALARDMRGRLPKAALSDAWLARQRPAEIDSYNPLRRGQLAVNLDDPRLDQAEIEGLRALGYLK